MTRHVLSLKHKYSENLTWYTNVAAPFNSADAHYDLGAGGRAVTTDCHDAAGASGASMPAPNAGLVRRFWEFPPACSGSSKRKFFVEKFDPGSKGRGFFMPI